jgi:hypothetical protein
MARKRPLLAISLALAAIVPAALAGCGGTPATPTAGTGASVTPGATAPFTGTVPAEMPTAPGENPAPVGTGVPAVVPTTQP